ncbi:hypothetical protein [Escherichia coli]|uniref:hypothetical protein n=1 Tax=Escherichia coli TaxID=562 RepID=UPI00145DC51D|nr:hypothetical protein [Escherichia coli]
MAFSALRSFYAFLPDILLRHVQSGYTLPVQRQQQVCGACQTVNYPGYRRAWSEHGLIRRGAGSDKWAALSGHRFCRVGALPLGMFWPAMLFTFHFGGVVTVRSMAGCRTGVSPSGFRFMSVRSFALPFHSDLRENMPCGPLVQPIVTGSVNFNDL